MIESIEFHSDLYRRDALELAAEKYRDRLRVVLAEAGTAIEAQVEVLDDGDASALRDEFCSEAFSATARRMRDLASNEPSNSEYRPADSDTPPWVLLNPFEEGDPLALGWVLESLSPVRSGATTMVLRHESLGLARVAIRRNSGAPLGVAHTPQLDFMLMNGGSGTAKTEESVGRVLVAFARALGQRPDGGPSDDIVAALLPHTETQSPRGRNGAAAATGRRLAPHVDSDAGTITFDVSEAGVSRLALYDTVLRFADRCFVYLTRPDATRIGVRLKPRGTLSTDELRVLVRDVTSALNLVARGHSSAAESNGGLPQLSRRQIDLETLVAELVEADPKTFGIGFEPERGPGHENMRILNVRGTGACNSECVFCIEKFNPTHRPMPSADATRQLILDSAGKFDMLFFASGEPTIHPKLFDYVELGRSVGFTCFGMSSHFRTFADPAFALKTLQAGFEYFDIALHAADEASQLDVNPIDDGGDSLWEALKGLAVLFKLADALGIRISVTQKIVISRLNVTQLESIFRATYDRGVRHFIFQPVRTLGLAPELQEKLAISEDEMLVHLNDLLHSTAGLGAVVKPYGFSRENLLAGEHVEHEQNRLKNIYGRIKSVRPDLNMPVKREERPADGRHWVEIKERDAGSFGFAADGGRPILDDSLERGLHLQFGCRMGSCGMCCARLVEGRVDQSSQIFLTDEQIRDGYVLLCQARPQSDCVIELCTEEEIDRL
jgi:2Fe-2S type ferredoxin